MTLDITPKNSTRQANKSNLRDANIALALRELFEITWSAIVQRVCMRSTFAYFEYRQCRLTAAFA